MMVDDTDFVFEDAEIQHPVDDSNAFFGVDDGPPTKPIPTTTDAANQTGVINHGLKENTPGSDVLFDRVMRGQLHDLQEQQASRVGMEDQQRRLQSLNRFLTERKPGEVSDRELEVVQTATQLHDVDPTTVLESEFAKRYMFDAVSYMEPEDPEVDAVSAPGSVDFGPVAKGFERVKKGQGFQTVAGEIRALNAEQGWVEAGYNIGKTMLPFYSNYTQSQAVPTPTNPALMSDDKRAQYEVIWGLPSDEAIRVARETVMKMHETSPYDAEQWIQGLMSFSKFHQQFDDFASVLDFTALYAPRIARATVGAARLTRRSFTPARAAEVAGDPRGSAALAKELHQRRTLANNSRPGSEFDLDVELPNSLDAMSILDTQHKPLSLEAAARVERHLLQNQELALRVVNEGVDITRLSSEAVLDLVSKGTMNNWTQVYKHLVDRVMASQLSDVDLSNANVRHLEVMLGSDDALPFARQAEAHANAKLYNLGPDQYTAVPHGNGWAIRMTKPVNETADEVIKLVGATADQDGLGEAFKQVYLNKILSSDELAPAELMAELKLAQFADVKSMELLTKMAKGFKMKGALSKKSMSDYLTWESTAPARRDPTLTGRSSNNLAEFQQDWGDKFGRMPDEQEITSYFTYRSFVEVDYMLRNNGIYRDKVMQGLEMFELKGPTKKKGQSVLMPEVEGRQLDSLPESIWSRLKGDNAGILILNEDLSNVKVGKVSRRHFNTGSIGRKDFEDGINVKDYTIIQVSPDGQAALRATKGLAVGKGKINFVLTKKTSTKPLKQQQLSYREGSHLAHDPRGAYVKQATIREGTYESDFSLLYQRTHAEAVRVVKGMEIARKKMVEFLDNPSVPGSRAALARTIIANTPYKPSRFLAMFHPEKGVMDVGEPLQAVKHGENIYDTNNLSERGINKMTDSPYNLYKGVDLEFSQHRGQNLSSVKFGTEDSPLMDLVDAPTINPIDMINRTARRVASSRTLSDLKFNSANRFVNEYAHILKPQPFELRANAEYHMLNPEFRKGLTRAENIEAKKAENYSKIMEWNLRHSKDDNQRGLNHIQQSLYESVLGSKHVDKKYGQYAMQFITDPLQKMRAYAFHTKLGMFNPIQLFLQANGAMHAIGIAGPTAAFKAVPAAMLMSRHLLSDVPGTMSIMRQHATAYGMKAEHYTEMYDLVKRYGWMNVGREVAQMDDIGNAVAMGAGPAGKVMKAGRKFFDVGEKVPRLMSYVLEYQKWRRLNPSGKLTDAVAAKMLNDADKGAVNMTGASHGWAQKDWRASLTQFMSYPMRVSEQILGKRLTVKEKATLLTTYGAVYGVPVTLGATTGFWPWKEELRDYAARNGVVIGDDLIEEVIVEGIMGTAINHTTGTKFNTSERLGPGGTPAIRDAIYEGEVGNLIFGASGSIIWDQLSLLSPALGAVSSTFDSGSWDMTWADAKTAVSSVSSLNNATKLWFATQYGKHFSRAGLEMDEVTAKEGWFMALLGVQPERLLESHANRQVLKDKSARFKEGSRAIHDLWTKALESAQAGDDDTADKYWRRAHALNMGYAWDHKEQKRLYDTFRGKQRGMLEGVDMRYGSNPKNYERYKLLKDRKHRELGNGE